MWMVRAGRGGEHLELFRTKTFVAIGMASREIGPDSLAATKTDLREMYRRHFPHLSEGKRQHWASQLARFIHEMANGDSVVTYDPEARRYYIGTIAGPAEHRVDVSADLATSRKVKWTGQVLRDALTPQARNVLGSVLTLFKLDAVTADELASRAVLDSTSTRLLPQNRRVMSHRLRPTVRRLRLFATTLLNARMSSFKT